MKSLLLGTGAVLLLLGAGTTERSRACECPDTNFDRSFQKAEIVFQGQRSKVVDSKGGARAEFRIERIWKGNAPKTVSVWTDGSKACGVDFRPHDLWLVYLREDSSGKFRTSICDRTQPLLYAEEDLEALESRQNQAGTQNPNESEIASAESVRKEVENAIRFGKLVAEMSGSGESWAEVSFKARLYHGPNNHPLVRKYEVSGTEGGTSIQVAYYYDGRGILRVSERFFRHERGNELRSVSYFDPTGVLLTKKERSVAGKGWSERFKYAVRNPRRHLRDLHVE